AVAATGATLWGPAAGVVAGLVYATGGFTAVGANSLSTDMLLTMFVTLAMLCYFRALGTGRGAWVVGMWAAFGLAFATKGPVALIPLLAILPWHRRAPRAVKLANGAGLAIGAVLAFGWFAVEIFRHPDLLRYLVGEEVVARVATNEFRRNGAWYVPLVMYLPVVTFGAGAWTFLALRPVVREGLWRPSAAWTRLKSAEPEGLLLLWIVVGFIIFSLAKSRLPLYMLPLLTPLSLLVSRGVATWLRGPRPWRVIGILGAALATVIVVGKGVAAGLDSRHDMKPLAAVVLPMTSPRTRVVVIDKQHMYGLQFYLGGRLDRYYAGTHVNAIDPAHARAEAERRRLRGEAPETITVETRTYARRRGEAE
ncbi:MAG: glycosyltransferase family 39 protein, partial [Myxococcales bacterium]|nr:glycosyltransferase family 39 protein [Myxococcales bacterium]